MFTLISSVLGIIATIVAWNLNPRRRVYAELDEIYKELEKLYVRRDKALQTNNSDELTIVTDLIISLCSRKAVLLQRLRKGL